GAGCPDRGGQASARGGLGTILGAEPEPISLWTRAVSARFLSVIKGGQASASSLMVALATVLSGSACAAGVVEREAGWQLGSGFASATVVITGPSASETTEQSCGAKDMLEARCLRALYKNVPAQWPAPTIDPGQPWQEWGPVPWPGSSAQPEAAEDARNTQI